MVRFRNPDEGVVVFEDMVKGAIAVQNGELDDLVILRADGVPTYNFGVVVDDLDMKITHVIRGDDHVNNTPRQINILRALGAPLPHYAHVPMILGHDGERLSKRHGAVGVLQSAMTATCRRRSSTIWRVSAGRTGTTRSSPWTSSSSGSIWRRSIARQPGLIWKSCGGPTSSI